jgi:hypothetical protein
MQTDIHALSGIRTHDPRVRAREDSHALEGAATVIGYYVHIVLILLINKKFWEEVITYFPLILHGLHRERRVQWFFYYCMCIRCHSNVNTEPLPSNGRRIYIQAHRLIWGIYKIPGEMSSFAVINMPSLIKIGSGLRTLMGVRWI